MVAGILFASSVQFYRRHPLQLLLSVIGIVLGVGIVTAVWITNSSSQRAFKLSTEALYGKATHHIVGAQGVHNDAYVAIKREFPRIAAAPIVEGQVLINQNVFTLIGIDPFAELPFQRLLSDGLAANANINNAVTSGAAANGTVSNNADKLLQGLSGNGLLMSEVSFQRSGWQLNDMLLIESGKDTHNIPVIGVFSSRNAAASEGLVLADIALAQSLLHQGDKLDRIDLVLPMEAESKLAAALPANLKLMPASSRQSTMEAMTRGFQINLTAMSLLSLLVGAFLIHNTMSFAVLQRRELYAIKRTIGISSHWLFASIVMEAFVISLIGSLIGVVLGFTLAHQLIKLTTRTINDLYFVLHVQEVWFTPALLAGGLMLGIVSSVLAASISAFDASRTSPIQAKQRSRTENTTRQALPVLAASGVVVMLYGFALATDKSVSLVLGFVALLLVIVGYGFIMPYLVSLISRLLNKRFASTSAMWSMAAGSIDRNISRTGLAIAALAIAVSSTFGVDVMIGSFRSSVDNWLKNTLMSDVYLSVPATLGAENSDALPPALLSSMTRNKAIDSISTGLSLNVNTSVGEFDMLALQPHNDLPVGITILSDDKNAVWDSFVNNKALLVSEPFANKYQLRTGDSITVFTEQNGDIPFSIAGVVQDYASSHGALTIHRNTFNQHWRTRDVGTLGLLFTPETNTTNAIEALRKQLKEEGYVVKLQANSAIHTDSLAIFDRTFEVTKVLRWLTVGVAFIGIFSALLALNLERSREFAVLRATGFSKAQLTGLIMSQTVIMGLCAGVLAIPIGLIMAEILIHVINLRSFGWSMQSLIPDGAVVRTFWLACLAALLAGLYPAWQLSRSNIARQLRDE